MEDVSASVPTIHRLTGSSKTWQVAIKVSWGAQIPTTPNPRPGNCSRTQGSHPRWGKPRGALKEAARAWNLEWVSRRENLILCMPQFPWQ